MTANEKSILRARILKWLTRIFLIIIAVIMLFPLVWNIYSSFKTNTEFLANAFALPGGLEWDNYARAIEKSELGANIFNSLFIVVETLCILTVCAIPCSYCLVRYKFFGVKVITTVYMAAIFIQATYIMIPLFLQMNSLGLLNNRPAMGFLYAAMQFPFAIFLLTGFMRSIPRDYEEAAMIDGCHERLERVPGSIGHAGRRCQTDSACRHCEPVRGAAVRDRLGRALRGAGPGAHPHGRAVPDRSKAAASGYERGRHQRVKLMSAGRKTNHVQGHPSRRAQAAR